MSVFTKASKCICKASNATYFYRKILTLFQRNTEESGQFKYCQYTRYVELLQKTLLNLPAEANGYLVLALNSKMEFAAASGMVTTTDDELDIIDGGMLEPGKESKQ